MKGAWAGFVSVAVLLGALSGFSGTAFAQTDVTREFKVFDSDGVTHRRCGFLAKRGGDWHLEGCPSMFAVIAEDQCNNQVLDVGESCDQSAVNGACPIGMNCRDCEECVVGPTPTPSPVPTATPGPIVTGTAECPDGILPKMDIPGTDVWGIDWIVAAPNVTRTYCFNLNFDSTRLSLNVLDRGGNQCSNKVAEFIPPVGSGLASQRDTGINASYRFFAPTPLPKGLWRIRLTTEMSATCSSWYWVAVLQ